MSPYTEIPGLEEVVLEESYVLGIDATPGRLVLRMDFVLAAGHPLYHAPAPGAVECTERGEILFRRVTSLDWSGQGAVPATDLTGEVDYGHIDSFEWTPGHYHLEGDWGVLHVECGDVQLRIPGP